MKTLMIVVGLAVFGFYAMATGYIWGHAEGRRTPADQFTATGATCWRDAQGTADTWALTPVGDPTTAATIRIQDGAFDGLWGWGAFTETEPRRYERHHQGADGAPYRLSLEIDQAAGTFTLNVERLTEPRGIVGQVRGTAEREMTVRDPDPGRG